MTALRPSQASVKGASLEAQSRKKEKMARSKHPLLTTSFQYVEYMPENTSA